METKEHMPWIAVMLATASAFVGVRYRSQMLTDPRLRSMTAAVLAICLLLVAFVSLMGVFVNKVAPVQ
jgi:ABC-type Fe3+-siderophore transport system permease subunit